ncbi:hypothetical protein LIER_24486 [Lithospermum erythrorhizon]|uniref:Uncharacterized protein n=1 Tax=Lithospermum erythrorhizon TaxID=34254 RepID=A0AAV3R181_LITER
MTKNISRDNSLAFLTLPPTTATSSPAGESSGSFSNVGGGFLSAQESLEEVGFSRNEFRQSPLAGSVEFYERHLFEFDRLPRLLSASLTARKPHLRKNTRLTICEGHDGTETSNGEVLIFPDRIRYRRLTHFDIDIFIEEVLVKDGEWSPGTAEALRGWYVFVCCHGTRDRRCGVCGPAVVDRFREEIQLRGLQRKVSISVCSHVGGHRYAGNVITFGPNSKKEINGHWYVKREIIDDLWRGQMGLSEEDHIKAHEERLKVDEKINVMSSDNSTQCNENNTDVCKSHESMECCQANGSYGCCQDSLSPDASNNSEFNKPSPKLLAVKRSFFKQLRQNKNVKGVPSRSVYSIPTWYENWECEDT